MLIWIKWFGFKREISAAQEDAIRWYKDSLVTGTGEDKLGSATELQALATKAVEAKKTSLSTDLNRYLAIANPANEEGFMKEVHVLLKCFFVFCVRIGTVRIRVGLPKFFFLVWTQIVPPVESLWTVGMVLGGTVDLPCSRIQSHRGWGLWFSIVFCVEIGTVRIRVGLPKLHILMLFWFCRQKLFHQWSPFGQLAWCLGALLHPPALGSEATEGGGHAFLLFFLWRLGLFGSEWICQSSFFLF